MRKNLFWGEAQKAKKKCKTNRSGQPTESFNLVIMKNVFFLAKQAMVFPECLISLLLSPIRAIFFEIPKRINK